MNKHVFVDMYNQIIEVVLKLYKRFKYFIRRVAKMNEKTCFC